ncbi:MAG: glucose-6-phosphate dehydrogenase assembly protein OpcA [Candidatus Eremiobacteraeota bacterium]|nr:glucose-6-phosphate dehydrogenase assembly protein OpcA [Candidatus Eremiobacteraeota bacterium]
MHVDSVGDTQAILAQLRKSREAAAVDKANAAASVAMLNFLVFVDDPTHRSWVLERAARVASKHPSRLIVLDSTSSISGVDVATEAREAGGAVLVNERVDIGVATTGHAAIISLTQELSVPEIPTVLWWSGGRLLQSRTFSGLAQLATTVLVDSSGKVRGDEAIRELGEFVTRFPNVALRDLAFLRLAPWQNMIAGFFDAPALREDLFSLTSLDIESGSDAEALYLGGWLGSRLSWEIDHRDAFRDRSGRTIPFTRVAKGDQRRVLSVCLSAGDSAYCAELSPDDPNVVGLAVEGPKARPMQYVPLGNIDNTSLIERAIIENVRDPIFETSLLTVRDLLG